MELPDVDKSKIINLESEKFSVNYQNGLKAYESEFYDEAIEYFENSIDEFIEAEDDCRFYCEGSFEPGWYPQFTIALSSKKPVFNMENVDREGFLKKVANTGGVWSKIDVFRSY